MADNEKPPNNQPKQDLTPIEKVATQENSTVAPAAKGSFLEKIGQSYRTTTAREHFEEQRLREIDQQKLAKLAEKAEAIREGIRAGAPKEVVPDLENAIKAIEEKQEKYEGRVSTYHQVRQERFGKLAEAKAREEFEPGGDVMAASRSSEAQLSSAQHLGKPYKQLEQDIGAGQARLKEIQEQATKLAPQEVSTDPNMVKQAREGIPKLQSEKEELIKKLGAQVAAQRYMKSTGKDPESELDNLLRAGTKAEKTLFKAGVAEKLKEGGDLHVLKQKEIELSRELVKALEEFKGATEDTTRAEAQAKAEGKKKQLEETQEAISQGGGSGNMGGISRIGAFAAKAAVVVGAATQAYENIAIHQTNQITTNRTAAASAANDIYYRRMKGAAGDMTQISLFEKGAFEDSISEAFKSRTNKQMVNTGHTLTAGLGATAAVAAGLMTASATAAIAGGLMAAGAATSATGVGAIAGVPMMAIGAILATGAVAQGISSTVSQGTDLVRGGSANREFLDEYSRQVQRHEAETHVTGQQRQRLYDFGQSMRTVSLAAGLGQEATEINLKTGRTNMSGGKEIMGTMEHGGGAMLDMVQRSGLTPEQFAEQAAPAARAQGSTFRIQQVEQAAAYQRAGVADIGTVMGGMTRLSQAGANNPQANFASVLEVAFTKSLNSAESLNRLVENTAATAERSAGARIGMDVQGAAAGTIAQLINPDIQNKEFAVTRAATAAEDIRRRSTDVSASFESMLSIGDISRAGKVDFATAAVMRRMDPETLNAMSAKVGDIKKMEPNSTDRLAAEKDLAQKMRTAGIGDLTTGDKININEFEAAAKAKRLAVVKNNLATMIGVPTNTPGRKELMEGEVDNPEEFIKGHPLLMSRMDKAKAAAGQQSTAEEDIRSIAGPMTPSKEGLTAAGKAAAGEAEGPRKQLNEMAEMIGKATTSEAKKAAEEFGNNLNKSFGTFLEGMKKNQEALLKTDSKVGPEMSEMFSDGAKMFNSSVQDFDKILNNFAAKYGASGGGSVPRPPGAAGSYQDKKQ